MKTEFICRKIHAFSGPLEDDPDNSGANEPPDSDDYGADSFP